MEPRIQYAKTEDGVSIAYYTIGGGPALLLIPAGPGTHIQLESQVPARQAFYNALTAGRMLVRYDRRGSGLSDDVTEPVSLETSLLDLAAVADHLQLEAFSLLSPVFSGPIAIAFASRNPERVSNLILWCTSARAADIFSNSPRDRALGALRQADWHLYTEVVAFISVGWDAPDAGRAFGARLRETMTPESHRRDFVEMAKLDATADLDGVSARTLVIHRGENRGSGVRTARKLASTIRGARLLLLEGTSSALTAGDTETAVAAIHEFLDDGKAPDSALSSADTHTILFTDMESSTALTQSLGDAKAQELVRAHNTIVREALSAHDGTEIKHTGDGIMASFAGASSALGCAVAIQKAVASRAAEQPDIPLGLRVGLNAGEPVVEEQDLFGASVQLARRICDHAEPGQILVSNVVRELAMGKGFLFGDIGEVVPKGFEEPVRLYEVKWRDE